MDQQILILTENEELGQLIELLFHNEAAIYQTSNLEFAKIILNKQLISLIILDETYQNQGWQKEMNALANSTQLPEIRCTVIQRPKKETKQMGYYKKKIIQIPKPINLLELKNHINELDI